MSREPETHTISQLLDIVLVKAKEKPLSFDQIFHIFANRGYAFMFVFLSAPFCLPLTIPGTSTIFGLVIAFLGLRMALQHHLWWPKWVTKKKVTYSQLEKFVKFAQGFFQRIQKIIYPRLSFLTASKTLIRCHGLFVCLMALLLSLPIPIPITNMVVAIPIFLIGLGLLEDDGVAISLGYLIGFVGIIVFAGLFILGEQGISMLIRKIL